MTEFLSRITEYQWFPQWYVAQYGLNQKSNTSAFICRGNIQLILAKDCKIPPPKNHCFIGQHGGNGIDRNLVTVISLDNLSELNIDGVRLFRGVNLALGNSANLKIGTGTYISWRSKIYASTSITIGKNCAISFDVKILDDDGHGFGNPPYSAPIVIEDDVWIGCNCLILKGVTIGAGSVVAAGAVVTKTCPPRSLIGGVPAKVIREDVMWTDEIRNKLKVPSRSLARPDPCF
jgi:acetyltransferase-like isoleucine patch superfamily enzyme